MLLFHRSGQNEIVMVSNQIIAPPVNQNTDIRTQPPTRKIPKQDLRFTSNSIKPLFSTGIFNPHMAPPTVTGLSVQFQPMMQSQQVVENHQIIDQQPQPHFQTQIQHMNQSMQQQINENQQKINGIPFSVQNVPQPVPYPQQVLYWVFYPQLFFYMYLQKTHLILQKKNSSAHSDLSAFKIGRFGCMIF